MVTSRKPLLLLDMDGVITDFMYGAAKVFGVDHEWLMSSAPKGSYYLFQDVLKVDQEGFDTHPGFMEETFWTELPELPWAKELHTELQKRGDIRFVTKPMPHPACLSGKLKWLRKFTDNPKFVDMIPTHEKHLLARPDRILIDDCEKNCDLFYRENGQAILFPRHWNKDHKLEHKCLEHTLNKLDTIIDWWH